MRQWRALIFGLAILFLACCPAAAQLPAAADPILNKAASVVRRSREEFDKKNQKPLTEARDDLKELVADLNKKGKVKEATAVQGLLNAGNLEAEVFRRVAAKAIPQNSIAASLVGRWTHPNGTLVYYFSPNGEFSETHKQGNAVNATGSWQVTASEEVTVSLSNQHSFVIRMAGNDRIAVLTWGPDKKLAGDGLVCDRIR